MVVVTPFVTAFVGLVGALAMPHPHASNIASKSTTITNSSTGIIDGYYYSCYIENGSGATMSINEARYSLTWDSSSEDVVAGIGWQTGAIRDIKYTGSIDAGGDSLLALYGWTTDPLVEYYVIETFGTYNPGSGGTHKGYVTSDGSTYDVYEVVRSNAPSIQGTRTFNQYLSIRQTQRTEGTITLGSHFKAWAEFGMNLGAFGYQIMATEGYESSGTSSIELL
ncbi:glycoside hydrolase family 11 protein [Polychaeton citri CBS 116435]|uniref:Endo-1,4-beta-xylanase n=1 Tax=Polychaeton citri CBS 116435 TaxID=1314669 RepID=A0A9P4ULG8_9PEZI|nr:glycoside hydrolase family 11 protein [Polychaeton citri CBS 116435]